MSYASDWAATYAQTGSSEAANAAANAAAYGNSSGPSTASQLAEALSGTNFSSGTEVSGGGNSYSYSGGGSGNTTPTITSTSPYSSANEENKSVSNSIFFPDQSNYLNTSSWLQSNPASASTSNSGLGMNLLGNTSSGVFIPTAKYTVDAEGNIIRTENTEAVSKTGASPILNDKGDSTNTFNGLGFAYTDKYNFPHVSNDYQTAVDYSGNGDISSYTGSYGGGYALGEGGSRVFIPLAGAVQYGNDVSTPTTGVTSSGVGTSVNNIANLDTNLTADRAKGLSNMLMSRDATQTATDTDYDLLLRQSQGANYANLTPDEKASIIQYMKILRGGA